MHGVRQGRAVAAYAAAKLEPEPELAPKEVKFAPVDTPESASDLPQIIVDYMQHQSADVFAENATNEEQRLAERFKGVLQMAVDGKLAAWEDDAMSLVALVIALDQFPRTIYRAKRRMYVGEEQLKIVLRRAVEETSVIQDVAPMHMLFCCLALSHQEDIYSQKLGVKLWKSVKPTFSTTDEIHKYERVFENNLAIIEELGRFPQRNKLLGRASTEAEEAWQQKKAPRIRCGCSALRSRQKPRARLRRQPRRVAGSACSKAWARRPSKMLSRPNTPPTTTTNSHTTPHETIQTPPKLQCTILPTVTPVTYTRALLKCVSLYLFLHCPFFFFSFLFFSFFSFFFFFFFLSFFSFFFFFFLLLAIVFTIFVCAGVVAAFICDASNASH